MGVCTVPYQENDDRKSAQRAYLKYAGIGTQFGVTIALFTWFGTWLDNRFDTTPYLTLVLALIGITGGMLSIIYTVK